MSECIRIAVVDSHPIFRKELIDTISGPKIVVVAQGEAVDDVMPIVMKLKPDILIMDLSVSVQAIRVADMAMRTHKGLRIMILTASNDEADVIDALRAGIHGYILKGVTGPELINAIETVAAGKPYITPGLASRLLMVSKGKALSAGKAIEIDLSIRDRWVLQHLAKGLSNQQLASELGVNVRTVKYYLTQIFRKLRVNSRLEAIVKAQKMGFRYNGRF